MTAAGAGPRWTPGRRALLRALWARHARSISGIDGRPGRQRRVAGPASLMLRGYCATSVKATDLGGTTRVQSRSNLMEFVLDRHQRCESANHETRVHSRRRGGHRGSRGSGLLVCADSFLQHRATVDRGRAATSRARGLAQGWHPAPARDVGARRRPAVHRAGSRSPTGIENRPVPAGD